MNRDPNSNNPAENFLDSQEFAEFLEHIEGDRELTNNNNTDFDGFATMVNEEIAPLAKKSRRLEGELPDRVTFTELPSDDEISEIFSENLTWQDERSQPQDDDGWFDFSGEELLETPTFEIPSPSEAPHLISYADELADLLTGDDNFTSQPIAAESNELEDELSAFLNQDTTNTNIDDSSENWDALKELLAADEQETIHSPTQEAWQNSTAAIAPQPLPEAAEFDELAALLDEPNATPSLSAPALPSSDDFGDLEAMLGDASTPAPTNGASAPKDDFDDLEQLLGKPEGNQKNSAATTQNTPVPLSRSRTPVSKPKFDQTMRVPVKQLDNLSNLIGELVVKRNTLEDDQERLRQSLDNLLNQVQSLGEMGARMHDLYERTLLEGALLASRNQNRGFGNGNGAAPEIANNEIERVDGDLDALEMDRFTGFHLISQEMIELIVRIRESTSDIQFLVDDTDQVTRTLRQATTQLQEGMTKSRMVAFSQTAERLPRAIREVSIKLNKQAKLQVEGKDVLIDKMILEQLYNPMTHLVNNAIAHGIEMPEERVRNGKPPEGRVTVRAFIQGNQTVITVSDDGAGINPERVKFKAIEKGLISKSQARALSKQEVYDFLFHPGFSTKDSADDFAGRGVGLDVVYTNLSEIRGTVSIDSAIGKGTTFTIRLPLTLSICKALCCVSERSRIAFPIDGVEDTKDYLSNDIIHDEEGRKCIRWREMELPIYTLSELLNYNRQISRRPSYTNRSADEDLMPMVILRSAGNLLALQVDRVLGEQEIVIKQLEGPIPKPAGIAGATVLGDGSVMPIGDVLELIEIAQGRMRADSSGSLWKKTYIPVQSEEEVRSEPTVLIVDDSITVRQLLSLSFNKTGYHVEQARDGQEALEKLQSGLPCNIIFCDIEMPRMNGLELLSNLQQDEKLSKIPVALLTSRGAQRHRTVAAKLGASGYFTKPYTERDLLDAAARMLKGEVLLPGSIKTSKVVKTEEAQAEQLSLTSEPSSLITASKAPENSSPAPRKSDYMVLIVDDSVMVREMLSMTFNKAGYRVEQARDGQEAWEKLRGGLPCDLILCDIEMPRMNGLELLSRLQEDEKLSEIPMAMITSRGAQKMQNIAAERGAKGYFVKPYIEDVLLDAAKRLLAGEVLLKKSAGVEE
jgi:chemotaxis protein histidine kinase CheA/DNA-binding response OmpR family regulator